MVCNTCFVAILFRSKWMRTGVLALRRESARLFARTNVLTLDGEKNQIDQDVAALNRELKALL